MDNVMTKEVKELRKQKILNTEIYIVDDEDLVIQTLALYLRSAGFKNIRCFNDSITAVESFKEHRPDLILTDLQMPDLDGNFLIRITRSFPRLWSIPILVVTAGSEEDACADAVHFGADCIIPKPVKRSKLIASVVNAINASQEQTRERNRGRWS